MPVFVHELADSPRITMNRKGGAAVRHALLAWNDIPAFTLELFPFDPRTGYPYTASYPGLPWLVVESVDFKTFTEAPLNNPSGAVNTYDLADAVITYAPPRYDQQQQSGQGGDRSGPGGGQGSTSGQNQTFVTHDVSIGGEFLTLGNQALQWVDTSQVTSDVHAGLIVPTIEHSITWNFVSKPPWSAIRACVGHVNGPQFANEKLNPAMFLFLGATAKRDLSLTGSPFWTLNYKFTEKSTAKPDGTPYTDGDPSNDGPVNWNYFYRPDKAQFQRMLRVTPDGLRNIYPLADFSVLFKEGP